MAGEYLEELNPQQRAAVEYLEGPALVIAGAGSGKTRVLTYKIVHLLHSGHEAGHILALTFTNKAAREMLERVERLTGARTASRMWMGTFHSVFARMLRIHADRIGFKSNFTIYDTSDSKSLVKSIIKDLKLDTDIYRPSTVMSAISWAKNHLLSPEDYAADHALMRADSDARRGRTADIYRIYRDRLKIAGAMDFDDLLFFTNVLLRDNEDIRDHYRKYFTYILVDEYQDTNFAQHVIVRQLTGTDGPLTVVGDDAQSIYSFRGANIRNILDLHESFPRLRTFKLEQNYRSTQNIINAANSLIARNKEQIPKEVFSTRDAGEKVEVLQCYNDYEEGYAVAAGISRRRMRTHCLYGDCAILYRTNAQSRVLEEALRNRNIPYRIYGGLAFYQRKEIKDAVCYFRLAVNPTDDEAFRRVINTPKRGIGDTSVAKIAALAIASGQPLLAVASDPVALASVMTTGAARKVTDFAAMMAEFVGAHAQGAPAEELAKRMIERTGLLKQYISEQTPENISKRDNIFELLKAVTDNAAKAREMSPSDPYTMAQFLAEISLLTDQDTAREDEDAVTLMTVHAAKGLEFENIFITGAEEDLFPSSMCRTPSEIEEERRLMYVAVTRAKSFCSISYTRRRTVNGKIVSPLPSRFIAEMNRSYLRLMAGSSLGNDISKPARPQPQALRPSPVSNPPRPWDRDRTPAPTPATSAPAGADTGEYRLFKASELDCGLQIEHRNFGTGTIAEVDTAGTEARVVVEFADGSARTLLLKYAKFKLV